MIITDAKYKINQVVFEKGVEIKNRSSQAAPNGAVDGTLTRTVSHTPLKRARMPIPPRPREHIYYTHGGDACQALREKIFVSLPQWCGSEWNRAPVRVRSGHILHS